jgi:hypothetical protein
MQKIGQISGHMSSDRGATCLMRIRGTETRQQILGYDVITGVLGWAR